LRVDRVTSGYLSNRSVLSTPTGITKPLSSDSGGGVGVRHSQRPKTKDNGGLIMLHQIDNVMLFVPLDTLPRELSSNTERVVRFDGRSPRAQLNTTGLTRNDRQE
jgi:hypothetical protein